MAIESHLPTEKAADTTGCENLQWTVQEIAESIDDQNIAGWETMDDAAQQTVADGLYQDHLRRTIKTIRERSPILDQFARQGKIKIVGAMYDVRTGEVSFIE